MITQDDVLYMIVTDRFADGDPTNNGAVDRGDLDQRHGGDLMGIVQRMPYLSRPGVTALWITPVYQNPAYAYHGYHPAGLRERGPAPVQPLDSAPRAAGRWSGASSRSRTSTSSR